MRAGTDLRRSLRSVVKPVLLSGLTTTAGFASLALAKNPALQGLGRYPEARSVLTGLQTRFPHAPGLDVELGFVSLREKKFAEAEKVARAAGESEERDRWIVIAVAGAAGAKAAIKVAGDLRSGASRNDVIAYAAFTMLLLQRYDVFAELVAETGRAAKLPPDVAAVLAKLIGHPEIKPGSADPRVAALDVLMSIVDHARRTPVFLDATVEREARSSVNQYLPAGLRNAGGVRFMSDLLQSMMAVQVEGDAGLWRVVLSARGQAYQQYFVLDHGIAKLIGSSEALAAVGRYALRTTDVRARRLLDWVRNDVDKSTAAGVAVFKQLWGSGVPATHEAVLLAAAALAGDTDPERVIPIGVRCASTLPEADLACHQMLLSVYTAGQRWPDVVAQIEAIEQLRPDRAASLMRSHAWALTNSGRLDEADQLLDGVLAKDPDNLDALVSRFWVAAYRGQNTETERRADAVVHHPHVTPNALNTIAWGQLGTGSDLTAALALARQAVQAGPNWYPSLNTLAAIEAEAGELDRAITDNWKAIERRDAGEPADPDWYVAGRIDEQLGLTGDAIAAYNHVTKDTGVFTTYEYAQRRLAVIRRAH
jgi:tetratricopeptide (TPR) repeat protein